MQLGEFRPGNRDHFRRGVQLHGAGAERDHRLVKRQILALQTVHITHHLGFAVVAVEYRVRQDRILTQHARRDRLAIFAYRRVQSVDVQTVIVARQQGEQSLHVFT
ncbi:hypothetical protein D3C75_1013300 [compost metagenome]